MAFSTALSAPQLVTLRGSSTVAPSYAGTLYVSTCPNTNIYTARVNQASFTASFAQVTYDGGSGTLADVVDGMTVLISHSSDRAKAFFRGRVRKAPGASTLYINETSAALADNDYIFVIDDFAIHDKLGRMVSGVLKMDYEIAFRQLLPVVYNLKSAYVDFVDVITDVYQIAFAPLALAATSGATISSWAWDVGDGTITVGSASTQNITATFPEGFRWVYLTVTDSGSRATVRKIPVWAHSDAYPPQLLEAARVDLSNPVASGVDGTVSTFIGIDALLDNTLVCMWNSEEIYQNATGSLTGDNVSFVGRIRKNTNTARPDESSFVDFERQHTLEGPLTQLGRIEQLPYEMLNKATPTLFGHIKDMTLWRGIVFLLSEASTFLELHSLSFDDVTNAYLAPTRNPVGNILNAVNDLASSINAAMQMNGSGSAEVVTDANMLISGRNSLVTVMNVTAADMLDMSLDHPQVRTVGRLKATGGAYNSVSNLYATYESLAPGVAQDYPEGTSQLDRQVLTANSSGAAAQSELNARAGMAFERAQEHDQLTVTFPDGYHSVLKPSLNQWYTFELADNEIDIVLVNTDRWLLIEVSQSYDNEANTRELRGIFSKETTGNPGQTVTYPAVPEVPLLEPTFPPIEPYPPFPIDPGDLIGDEPIVIVIPDGDIIPDNGNAIIVGTATQLLVVVNALLTSTPGTRDVTPPDMLGTIKDGRFGAGKDFYLLSTDDTDSIVYYTEDIFAGEVAWVENASVVGKYIQLVVTATQGEAYIYTVGSSTVTENSLSGDGDAPWTLVPFGVAPCALTVGTYNAGADRFEGTYCAGAQGKLQIAELDFGTPVTVLSVEIDFAWDATLVTGSPFFAGFINYDGVTVEDYAANSPSTDAQTITFDTPTAGVTVVGVGSSSFTNAGDGYSYITRIAISYEGPGGAETRYSDDFGVTWAAAEAVGDAPGTYGGLDTSKIGVQILAATDGQIEKAATGGAFTPYGGAVPTGGQASAAVLPRYEFGSGTVDNTGSTPEYLLFSNALATGESMWQVTASGATFTDITPIRASVEGLAVGYRCVTMWWRSGNKIVAVAEFGGAVRRLCCSDDGGSTWTFSGTLDDDALAVTTRKGDTAVKQVFIANGDTLGYCSNAFAATPLIHDKNIGVSEVLLFVEVYG